MKFTGWSAFIAFWAGYAIGQDKPIWSLAFAAMMILDSFAEYRLEKVSKDGKQDSAKD